MLITLDTLNPEYRFKNSYGGPVYFQLNLFGKDPVNLAYIDMYIRDYNDPNPNLTNIPDPISGLTTDPVSGNGYNAKEEKVACNIRVDPCCITCVTSPTMVLMLFNELRLVIADSPPAPTVTTTCGIWFDYWGNRGY